MSTWVQAMLGAGPRSVPPQDSPPRPNEDAAAAAFRQLYDAHFPFVWRTLRRFGVRDADLPDAMQEVFVVVHRRLPEFEGRARVTTWLYRICLHVARDRSRVAHVRRELPDGTAGEAAHDPRPDAAEQLERGGDLALFDRAIQALELEQRAVFTLFELEGLTGEQIAQTLQLPLGTVYSRLRLAREAFHRTVLRLAARSVGRPR